MKRPTNVLGRQLPLSLKQEARHPPAVQLHEDLLNALADLLLEALGKETNNQTSAQGDHDESED